MSTYSNVQRFRSRLFCAVSLAGGVLVLAPTAQAQTAHDYSLRSIAQPTITTAGYEGRPRQAILSIAPSSLENQPSIVPAVFDPALGRFVSAFGVARGAIGVSSTGSVSVVVNSLNSSVVFGSRADGVPLRSEATLTQSSAQVTPQNQANTTNMR